MKLAKNERNLLQHKANEITKRKMPCFEFLLVIAENHEAYISFIALFSNKFNSLFAIFSWILMRLRILSKISIDAIVNDINKAFSFQIFKLKNQFHASKHEIGKIFL